MATERKKPTKRKPGAPSASAGKPAAGRPSGSPPAEKVAQVPGVASGRQVESSQVAGMFGSAAPQGARTQNAAPSQSFRTIRGGKAPSPAPREADGPVTDGKRPRARKKRGIVGKVVLAVVLVVVLACAGFVGYLAWDRWGAYDDAADLQGTWLANGTDSQIVIDGETIRLTDDVAYRYEIDPFAKTITFTLGNMEGQGRYRFSPDRTQLVITDGPDYSWLSTLSEDLPWRLQALQDELSGEGDQSKVASSAPDGEEAGRTVLDRP